MRVRTLCGAVVSSLIVPALAAAPALGVATGGAAAEGPASKTAPAAATPGPTIHLSPVTARSRSLAYKGPIYEKTASGQVVPYVPSSSVSPSSVPASLTSATGGSPVGTASTVNTTSGAAPSASAPTPQPELLVPGSLARYVGGYAAAPMNAPATVQQVIWAANEIIGLPYIYGGGHGSFISPGYDCSGTVSFALHGANLLPTPMDSSEFMSWGSHGAGRWIAVFGNEGHAYMDIAGLRLDTSAADDPSNQQGPRWRPLRPGNPGYAVRHPLGL